MANLQQEYPLVLLGILEELANMRHWLSFQDLCRMVSTRFDLEHLVELRSLLFSAACRDSCFPATLFRDRVTTRGLGLSPIGVAADIVTIFNLIQMTGSAGDETNPMRSQLILPVDQSPGPFFPSADERRFTGQDWTHAHSDSGSRTIDQRMLFPKSNYTVRKRSSLPPDPISLVSSPPARARAVSFDWPHNTSLFSSGRVPGQAMQSIYLPLETDSESSTQDSLSGDSAPKDVFEPGQEETCVKRRDIFKKDFHNQSPLIPQVTISSDSPSPRGGHENLFPNHSFEVLTNPYPSPTATRPSPERRAKHESFDDLQDSTYFGPASTPEWSTVHLQPPRSQNTAWTEKSLSVDSNFGSRRAMLDSIPSHPSRSTPALNPGASSGRARGGKHGDDEVLASTGTQTDPPDPRRLRSLVHADRLSFMTSLDDPDMMCEDDISAIFRFLDDMSVCGSTGVLHPHDGGGGPANQDTHEARRGRLGQLQRLFHSLESSDDGVKASVCKLLLRMSQIERQLESLSEVKAEISQVLSALRRLDEKIQDPSAIAGAGDRGRWLGPPSAGLSSMGTPLVTPDTESSEPQPLSVSGHLFPGASSGSLDWNKWNASGEPKEVSGGQVDIKGGKAGKKGIISSRRASKSQSEEKSVVERPNVSYSARDWAVSFSKDKVGKAIHGKTGQMEQTASTSNLLSSKPSHLVGQVFNSALFRQKGGGLNSGFVNDPRLAEGGPVWTVEERISPLDLQARESLNPNNVDFWMEDIYTPGYDALLRRKEADLRRAKVCKVGAIIATAISIILVIVIPLCTMKS